MRAGSRGIGGQIARGVAALLLAAACGAAACVTGPATDPESAVRFDVGGNDPRIVVSFGDGIASGEGGSYLTQLAVLLAVDGRPEVRVVGEGIPGATSADAAARAAGVLARNRPAALLLAVGENDEAIRRPSVDIQGQLRDSASAIAAIIAAARGNRTLVAVSTLPPVCGSDRAVQRQRTALLNEEIRALALEAGAGDLGVVLVDAWRDFVAAAPPDGCALIGAAGERPNADGYRTLAISFAKRLEHVAW